MLMERYGPGQPGRYLHSILSPNGVIFSVCIFLYVKTAPADGSSMIRRSVLYKWILEGSLGIYLVHPLVLLYAQQLHRQTGFLLPMGLDLPIMGLAVLGVSAALIAAIRRVPVLRWSVG